MKKEYRRSSGLYVMLWMTVLSVLCLTACTPVDKKIYQKRSYLLSIEPPSAQESCLSTQRPEIRHCKVAPPFDGRHFIYQRSEVEYESDPYHLFLVPPAEQITHLMRQWYRRDYVSTQASSDTPGDHLYILESFVDRLVADFSVFDQPVARVCMHVQLSKYPPSGKTKVILVQKTYNAEQTLPARPAAQDIVIGLGECLQKILREFDTDCQTLLQDATL